jgi:netrin-G3 ligand
MFQAVFTNLEENTDYVFRVRAHTSQGAGPYSEKITVHTERDIVRAPMSVQAVATSDQSVEVWWEPVPSRSKVIGYKVVIILYIIMQISIRDILIYHAP